MKSLKLFILNGKCFCFFFDVNRKKECLSGKNNSRQCVMNENEKKYKSSIVSRQDDFQKKWAEQNKMFCVVVVVIVQEWILSDFDPCSIIVH